MLYTGIARFRRRPVMPEREQSSSRKLRHVAEEFVEQSQREFWLWKAQLLNDHLRLRFVCGAPESSDRLESSQRNYLLLLGAELRPQPVVKFGRELRVPRFVVGNQTHYGAHRRVFRVVRLM